VRTGWRGYSGEIGEIGARAKKISVWGVSGVCGVRQYGFEIRRKFSRGMEEFGGGDGHFHHPIMKAGKRGSSREPKEHREFKIFVGAGLWKQLHGESPFSRADQGNTGTPVVARTTVLATAL
jgi:hypothetical protein